MGAQDSDRKRLKGQKLIDGSVDLGGNTVLVTSETASK